MPVGTVYFTDLTTNTTLGSTTKITGSGNSGVATLVVSNLSVSISAHEIAATFGTTPPTPANYLGSTTYLQSPGDWFVTVGQDATTIAVSSSTSPNASVVGQAVTFSATVSAASPGSGTPTGKVAFYLDNTLFATVTLNGKGVATAAPAVSLLTAGPHTIKAAYAGDGNFTAIDNTGNLFRQIVQTQTLASLQAPQTLNNVAAGTFFSFQVTGLDKNGLQDYSLNGVPSGEKVVMVSGPSGASVVGQNGSPSFSFVNGVATVTIKVTKPGNYQLLLDTGLKDANGKEITALVAVNTLGHQS